MRWDLKNSIEKINNFFYNVQKYIAIQLIIENFEEII